MVGYCVFYWLQTVSLCETAISWQITENEQKILLRWNHASEGISGQPVPSDAHSHVNIIQASRFLDSAKETNKVVIHGPGFSRSHSHLFAVSNQSVSEWSILSGHV